MKKLYILKIGESVLTNKNIGKLYLHRQRIAKIAKNIKTALAKDENLNLIIVHGGGGPTHHIACAYNLQSGLNSTKNKLHGTMLVQFANQKLNTELSELFIKNNLPITPIHSNSIITQTNKKITTCHMDTIHHALKNNYTPIVYGNVVFDNTLTSSVCSGDTIVSYLATQLKAKKVFLATDVAGIFTKDPYKHSDATLIKKISLPNVFSESHIKLDKSHNIDAGGGFKGKLYSFKKFVDHLSSLKKLSYLMGQIQKIIKRLFQVIPLQQLTSRFNKLIAFYQNKAYLLIKKQTGRVFSSNRFSITLTPSSKLVVLA